MAYFLIIVGFAILIYSANALVDGACGLAKRYNIPDIVIGMTVVAFGTSMPEFFVNMNAAFNESSEIALTNILGSNILNILVILGVSASIYPLRCKLSTVKVEMPLAIIAALVVFIMGSNYLGLMNYGDGYIGVTRFDGVILLVIFAGFMFYTIRQARNQNNDDEVESYKEMKLWKAIMFIVVGLVGLGIGSELIVKNAVLVAEELGVSKAIIGVTIVALGTSLPELATSVDAAIKRNSDIAIANVVGSNIFNVFFILGLSAAIHPLDIYKTLLFDALMATFAGILLLAFVFFNKKHQITRVAGIVMLLCYAVYVYVLLTPELIDLVSSTLNSILPEKVVTQMH